MGMISIDWNPLPSCLWTANIPPLRGLICLSIECDVAFTSP